jgi:hypothetical protein
MSAHTTTLAMVCLQSRNGHVRYVPSGPLTHTRSTSFACPSWDQSPLRAGRQNPPPPTVPYPTSSMGVFLTRWMTFSVTLPSTIRLSPV